MDALPQSNKANIVTWILNVDLMVLNELKLSDLFFEFLMQGHKPFKNGSRVWEGLCPFRKPCCSLETDFVQKCHQGPTVLSSVVFPWVNKASAHFCSSFPLFLSHDCQSWTKHKNFLQYFSTSGQHFGHQRKENKANKQKPNTYFYWFHISLDRRKTPQDGKSISREQCS